MLVELKSLKPNPLRDFRIDPVEKKKVNELKQSIEEDGFWGGVVCRKIDGEIEVAAGQHRVEGAIAAGLKNAELFVSENIDDDSMVRIYARENSLQRGNTSTAVAGSIASAIRYIAKKTLKGDVGRNLPTWLKSQKAFETIRGQIETEKGIGWHVILDFFKNIEDINENIIKQQLSNLKTSGNYDRIIEEVNNEIAKEAEEAEGQAKEEEEKKKRADEAKKAREAAKESKKKREKERVFDFEGCSKYFENPAQLDVFRKCVTGKGIHPYLPIENQVRLAKAIVELAKEQKKELSGVFIKDNVVNMVLRVKSKERELSREEVKKLEERELIDKAKRYQHEFARNCKGMFAAGAKINSLLKTWPKDLTFPILGEFRNAVNDAKEVINELDRRI